MDLGKVIAAKTEKEKMDKISINNKMTDFRKSTSLRSTAPQQVSWHAVPPEMYHATYGKLKGPKNSDENSLGELFGNGVAQHNSSLITKKSQPVLPNIYSFDGRYINFQIDLKNTLNRHLVPDIDNEGFTANGLETTFDNLATVGGYFGTPMSYTVVDNSRYVEEELGLRTHRTPRDVAIMSEFWHIFFGSYKPHPVNNPKLSTGGMIRFSHDPQWKLALSRFLMVPENFEHILQLIEAEKWVELAYTFEIVFATYIQKRGQVDKLSKVRKVFDLLFAQTGGLEGEIITVDKRVVINGVEYEASAMRARVIHAGPWAINCLLQVVFTGHLQALFENYPETYSVNEPHQLKEQWDGHFIEVDDVGNFDLSIIEKDMKLAHDIMSEYWDERLVKASWQLIIAPYYSRPVTADGEKGIWVGNPLLQNLKVFAGNKSGHAGTSSFAKGFKSCDSMIVIDKVIPLVGKVHNFLKQELLIKMNNNGDDCVTGSKSSAIFKRYQKIRRDKSVGLYDVSPEVGHGYSGMLMVKENPEVNVYKPSPRIPSSLERIFVPERGIDSKLRRFWPIGMQVRIDTLTKTSDISREALDITMHTFNKHYSKTHGSFQEIIVKASNEMRLGIGQFSYQDKLLIDNPDRIHHMDLKGVDDSVIDLLYSKIPIQQFEFIFTKYYKGGLL